MNNNRKTKQQRKIRISMATKGTIDRPRLSVFRSNKFIYAQIVDDIKQKTICGASDKQLAETKGTKIEKAKKLGINIAELAKKNKVTQVVFDKGLYRYHGR